jgi:hypothetical protein
MKLGAVQYITPTQAIAINEDNAAQNTPAIDTRLAMAHGKEWFQTGHLRICQLEK